MKEEINKSKRKDKLSQENKKARQDKKNLKLDKIIIKSLEESN